MLKIPVGRSRFAMIDDADFALVSRFTWFPVLAPHVTYAATRVDGSQVYMHRMIMEAKKGQRLDHANRDGLDNQRSNLRFCTVSQNGANSKRRRDNKSGYRGVCWYPAYGKWRAYITAEGRMTTIGYFAEKADAARAYNAKAVELFGEFALTNQVA